MRARFYNPVRYCDPSGYIKNWVTPKANKDLLMIYSNPNISQADKNKILNVDIIELEKSDIINGFNQRRRYAIRRIFSTK